jgi:hypothetical protein
MYEFCIFWTNIGGEEIDAYNIRIFSKRGNYGKAALTCVIDAILLPPRLAIHPDGR